jgi:hypothetical protein
LIPANPKRRRVFFSFHYQRDNWSVCQIRNSWLASANHGAQPFYDHADWEKIQRQGDLAIKRWINGQLNGSSVTVVLTGPQTMDRKWVRYEIDESLRLGKGLLAVTMEGMNQKNGLPDLWDRYSAYGPFLHSQQTHPIYSWNGNNGRANLALWIERAARIAGK